MLKNILKIIIIFIIGMAGGIFATQILWPYFVERPFFYNQLPQNSPNVTDGKEIIIQENVALQNTIVKVEKAVVGIITKTKSGQTITGSGLIVTSDGLMVTLAELLPQGENFTFFVDGKVLNYQVLKRDLKNNLALVKIEGENLTTVSFANLEELKLGERIFLVGIIFDKETPLKIVNEGIVKFFNNDYIRTNIFEKKTLSGSPLFNIKGELVGLNTIDSEGKVTAISITKIRDFIKF